MQFEITSEVLTILAIGLPLLISHFVAARREGEWKGRMEARVDHLEADVADIRRELASIKAILLDKASAWGADQD